MHDHQTAKPSAWMVKQASHILPAGKVLDMAAGEGRNARWLAGKGFQVEAVDINAIALDTMRDDPNIKITVADLENADWQYKPEQFDAIVVCRYLHRPLFPKIRESLKISGVLIYETFMLGQEQYGRPKNPEFLLAPGELKQCFSKGFEIVAFEEGLLEEPPAMLQRICVIKTCAIKSR